MSALAFRPVVAATRHAKVLLIGEAGVGKTHAALTFPKPAMIDAEGSADWFSDRFTFQAVNTKSYADVVEVLRQIKNRQVPCETIIIDSLTSIYNGLVNTATEERLKNGSDDLRPLDWGRIKRKFSSLLDELYHKLPVNVVCVGWIKPEYAKPGDKVGNRTVGQNDLVKLGETFDGDRKTMYAFDFVFKIDGNDGKHTRATVVKSRSGVLKAGQTIPDFSWKTLETLLPHGAVEAGGMTDDEQTARDAHVLADDEARRSQPAVVYPSNDQTKDLVALAASLNMPSLKDWLAENIAPDFAQRKPALLTLAEYEQAMERLKAFAPPKPAQEAEKPAQSDDAGRMKARTQGRLFALLDERLSTEKEARLTFAAEHGIVVDSFSQLTELQARGLVRALEMIPPPREDDPEDALDAYAREKGLLP